MNRRIKHIKSSLIRLGSHLIGHDHYVRYVVIASPRTGSNLLMSLLSSHQSVYAYGEIFNNLQGRNCLQIWNDAFSPKLPYVKAVGFKIFYDHPLGSCDSEVWDLIQCDRTIRVIHLTRENLLRSQLSLWIAYKTDVWGLTPLMQDIPLEKRKIRIPVEKFINGLRANTQHQKRIETEFRKHQFLGITYEELTGNKQDVVNGVFDFLDVDPASVSTDLRKQNPEKIEDLVENYDEFRSKIRNTEFRHSLD